MIETARLDSENKRIDILWPGYNLSGEALHGFINQTSQKIDELWEEEYRRIPAGAVRMNSYRFVSEQLGRFSRNVIEECLDMARCEHNGCQRSKEIAEKVLTHISLKFVLSSVDRVQKQYPGFTDSESLFEEGIEMIYRKLNAGTLSQSTLNSDLFSRGQTMVAESLGISAIDLRAKSDVSFLKKDYEPEVRVSEKDVNLEAGLEAEELKNEVQYALNGLTDREREILQLRFCLNEDQDRAKSLEEVAEIFGVTRERIRQIEAGTLRKLRHPSRGSRLKEFYDQYRDSESFEALLNGAVNAIHFKDWQRALNNLKIVGKRCFSRIPDVYENRLLFLSIEPEFYTWSDEQLREYVKNIDADSFWKKYFYSDLESKIIYETIPRLRQIRRLRDKIPLEEVGFEIEKPASV